eukprot:256634_1
MKLFVAVLLETLVGLTLGGCGTEDINKAQLGMKSQTTNPGGTYYVSIYSGGNWATWDKVDNANCDDFGGEEDWFDTFNGIEGRWDGVAIYPCTRHGIIVSDITFWDGSKHVKLDTFEGNVAPEKCVTDIIGKPLWVDDIACPIVQIKLGSVDLPNPGTPSCPNPGRYINPNIDVKNPVDHDFYSLFEQQKSILNELNLLLIGMGIMVALSAVILCVVMVKRNKGAA